MMCSIDFCIVDDSILFNRETRPDVLWLWLQAEPVVEDLSALCVLQHRAELVDCG